MKDKGIVELAKKAKRGNDAAFADLLQKKMKDLLFYAYGILKDYQSAEDAVQEAAIKIYKGVGRLRDPAAIDAWMISIVKNECYIYLRKNRGINKEVDNGDEIIEYIEDEDDYIPEKYAEDKEAANLLYETILNLPLRQREVILLYYYEDLSYKEISVLQGRTIQTVSTNLIKARRMIRKQLEIKEAKGVNAWAGVAGTSVISRVLKEKADEQITEKMADDCYARCLARIDAIKKTPAGTRRLVANSYRNIITIVIVLCLAMVGAALAVNNYSEQKEAEIENDDNAVVIERIEENNSEIVFVDADCECGHMNPRSAELTKISIAFDRIEWVILDSSRQVRYSGEGHILTEELTSLVNAKENGRYSLLYKIYDKKGRIYEAERIFEIGLMEQFTG